MSSHPDDRLFNDCELWAVGGQDFELSREWNVGNKACVVSVSALDSTPRMTNAKTKATLVLLCAYNIDLMSQLPGFCISVLF